MEKRRQEFKNPGIKYRSRPFWAWNGELSEQELYRQLDVLKEMGFGGAFIHSRVGLETEYMGREWMELVDRCLAYGREIGLEMWIYDEDRWPSGTAGGAVTREKKNRTRRIQMRILSEEEAALFLQQAEKAISEENKPEEERKEEQKGKQPEIKHAEDKQENIEKEEFIAAFRCDLEGHSYQNLRAYEGGKKEISAGTEKKPQKILVFTICESASSDNYNGYTYLDTMNREAVEDFLKAAQDRYERELSAESLCALQGFFTDEPHRGAYLCDFSEGNTQSVPYTEGLFEKFKDRYGYDLKDNLPALFLREEGQDCSAVALDYLELTQELFLTSYMEPYRDRCHRYGHLFTGHLLHEDSLSTQTCMMGSLMTGYAYMDIPGIDLLGEKTDCWWIGKQLSSVAHQTGKKQMLSELYGCTGWQMKLEDYKAVGDWQAMMGINLFCPHLSWYTMKGENKRDYPASIFYQSAWYKEYSLLEDYFARVHMCTEGAPADCHLLVLNPIRSVWARTYSGCFRWLLSDDPGIDRIEKQYEETFRMLMEAGIDFDYGEERILRQMGKVENGLLHVGECAYDKVLLSGVETMEESTWQLLTELISQGGRVIVAGEAPSMIRARKDSRVRELTAKAEQIPFEKEAIIRATRPAAPLYALDNHGRPVYLQAYEGEGEVRFVVLNMDREHSAENVELQIYREGRLEEWDARIGEIQELKAEAEIETEIETETETGTKTCSKVQKVTFSLAPGEEKIIVLSSFTQKVTRETTDNKTNYQTKTGAYLIDLQKEFSYRCSEANIAVLDRADVYLEEQQLAEGEEVLREDRILRDAMGLDYRGGEMMQPWYIRKYRPHLLERRRKVRAEFHFYVEDTEDLPPEMAIAAEYSQKAGKESGEENRIFLNGQELFPEEEYWIDPAFRKFRIKREMLEKGKNKISLTYSYGQSSGLEAIYLLGAFGVKLVPFENELTDEQSYEQSGKQRAEQRAEQTDEERAEQTDNQRGDFPALVYLTRMPESLSAGSITEQGFPFYSGSITYLLNEETKRKLQGDVEAEFSDLPAALAVLHGAGDKRILYPPYRAKVRDLCSIEMIFTRRNTFGPLHLPVEYRGNYGPDTFLTTGKEWRESLQLWPQGLPEVITLRKEW